MLVLTRRVGESITIGDDVRVYVLEIRGHQVRIGIEAPRSIPVHREELVRISRKEKPSLPPDLPLASSPKG